VNGAPGAAAAAPGPVFSVAAAGLEHVEYRIAAE